VVFGFDERGKVVWKVPLPGFHAWPFSDSICLARSSDPPALVSLERRSGRELWRWSAEEGHLVGVTSDRFPPDCTLVACTVETATEMIHLRLHPRSGQVVTSWTRPNELPWTGRRERTACPAQPLEKEITVASSSAFAFGFDPEARPVWRVPLLPGEWAQPYASRYALLSTQSSLRMLDRQSGHILWQRTYPHPIEFLSGDSEYLQIKLADGTYWLYETATGRPFRRPDAPLSQR